MIHCWVLHPCCARCSSSGINGDEEDLLHCCISIGQKVKMLAVETINRLYPNPPPLFLLAGHTANIAATNLPAMIHAIAHTRVPTIDCMYKINVGICQGCCNGSWDGFCNIWEICEVSCKGFCEDGGCRDLQWFLQWHWNVLCWFLAHDGSEVEFFGSSCSGFLQRVLQQVECSYLQLFFAIAHTMVPVIDHIYTIECWNLLGLLNGSWGGFCNGSEIFDVSCNGFCKVLVGCIDWSAMVLVMTYNSSCRGLAVEMCILRMFCNGSELGIYSSSCRGFCRGPLQSEPCHQLACFHNVQQHVFYPQSLLDWMWCRMQWWQRGSSSPNGLLRHHNLPPRLAPERLLWHLGQPSYTRHGLETKIGLAATFPPLQCCWHHLRHQ